MLCSVLCVAVSHARSLLFLSVCFFSRSRLSVGVSSASLLRSSSPWLAALCPSGLGLLDVSGSVLRWGSRAFPFRRSRSGELAGATSRLGLGGHGSVGPDSTRMMRTQHPRKIRSISPRRSHSSCYPCARLWSQFEKGALSSRSHFAIFSALRTRSPMDRDHSIADGGWSLS